ncbi:MAG TPA: ABC transporter permease [Clostridiaceae bacterium]|nr:ABC transporter permease [Clostridiaceae bacterium]
MLKYALKRILQTIPMLIVLSMVVFGMVRLIPGDPVKIMMGIDVASDSYEIEKERLGLNGTIVEQYVRWVERLFDGDMGTSIFTKKPVLQEIGNRFKPTLILAVGGTVLSSIIGIMFGLLAAIRHNRFTDHFLMVTSLIFVSTPSFFSALILILIFSLQLRWLPSIGLGSWKAAILPIVTLGLTAVGSLTRTTRSSMLDVVHQDYIRTARARGVPERTIVFRDAFRNALIPVLTSIGLRFGSLLAGATLVETVFSISGLGRFLVDGVGNRDYPVVQGTVLVMAISFVLVNLIVDLLYSAVDPRIKYS